MVSLRPRTRQVKPDSYATGFGDANLIDNPTPTTCYIIDSHSTSPESEAPQPPVYTIDISLPPEQRYQQVALDFQLKLDSLQELFDDVIKLLRVPSWLLHFLAWLFLRRLYSTEQTQEIKGISQAIQTPLYLLIAYNVFLDLFMGCTSGGVLTQASNGDEQRMMHFRTLDWGMPELRDVLVQYDFVEGPGSKVIASTMSYVGFVGVLTGVKKDLSVSLNFRPYHNDDGHFWSNIKFRLHQIAVLLGFRPSIASLLRDFVIPRRGTGFIKKEPGLENTRSDPHFGQPDICITLPSTPTTAAYLTFCTGDETIILEKDLRTAKILRSRSFITTTNHDERYDAEQYPPSPAGVPTLLRIFANPEADDFAGMDDIVKESVHRKKCLAKRWAHFQRRQKRSRGRGAGTEVEEKGVATRELKSWLLEYPVTNEDTHFVCIMDPRQGTIRWTKRFGEGDVGESDSDLSAVSI